MRSFMYLVIYICFLCKISAEKCVCGKQNALSRIIGGTMVKGNKYGWMAFFVIRNGLNQMVCGGAIINKHYILTAAHCFDEGSEEVKVAVGINNLESIKSYIAVKKVKKHEHYNSETIHNDIALVQLAEPLRFTEKIQPICLPNIGMKKFDSLVAAGWGKLYENGPNSDELLEVTLKVYPFEKCNKDSENELIPQQMCAADTGKDTCAGDSGGPLMYINKGQTFVVGVVSYGLDACGTGMRSVYTRVTEYLDWIKKNTNDSEVCQ